jgi:hypothetical protein
MNAMRNINSNFLMTSSQWWFIICCFLLGTSPLHAQNITSNQVAYSNGSTVTLIGSGFAANENVSLQVFHLDNTPVLNVSPWVVTTDVGGTFETAQNIPINASQTISGLKITAHARTSHSSVQYFLDGITPTQSNPGNDVISNNSDPNNDPPPPPSEFLIDCTGVPDPGNTLASSNPVCGNVAFSLSLQNSGGPGVAYQWQSNTGAGFTDIPGATDPAFTTSQSLGTNYQCVVTCTNSGLSTVSTSLLVSNSNPAGCPLTVVPGGSATEIAQTLLGPGVTISNAAINCTSNAYGIFSGGLANLGLNEGIVLTSGSAFDLIGPNTSPSQSTDNLAPGDPELDVLTTSPTFDACFISFDFVPTCDSIVFDYVFGSEEYPEFVNSQFNDVFAFFISGPGITGTQNIAEVPGALIPVEINNVNDGYAADCPDILPGPCMNCQYYVNNCTGNTLQYDGHTTALAAVAAVISGQSYHLKIAIADAGDPVYDSGVMLETKSLSCANTAVVEANAYRGCQDGQVRFCRNGSTADAQTIHYTIGGTAVNGVDYLTVADSIIIPAGQQCTILEIIPTLITTGVTKTVVLTTTDFTLTVNISDGVQVNTVVDVDQQCAFSVLTASGADTYTWSPAEGLTATTGEEIIASPAAQTTYTVIGRITESGCADTTTVTVNAGPPLFTYFRDADGDGYGNIMVTLVTCLVTPPAGYVINSADCNDAASTVHPGATEVCSNSIDDNCNGQVDENCTGCAIPSEMTAEDISATSALLTWDDMSDAKRYKVRYKKVGTSEWTKFTNVNSNSKLITGLTPSSQYVWETKSVCAADPIVASAWSAKESFTTEELRMGGENTGALELYPNPVSESFTLDLKLNSSANQSASVFLLNELGQIVYSSNEVTVNGELKKVIRMPSTAASGWYIVRVILNDQLIEKKLMYQR